MIRIIKVVGDKIHFPPSDNINRFCDIIEKSGLFDYSCKSKIDGYKIYTLNPHFDRLCKLHKVMNITPNIYDSYELVMTEVKKV